MTTQYYSGPNYFGRFVGFVLALVLGAAGFAVFVRHAPAGRLGRLATWIAGRAPALDASVPEVVAAMSRSKVQVLKIISWQGRPSRSKTSGTLAVRKCSRR